MKLEEHEAQVSLMEWWKLYSRTHKIDERLLFAIPNGGLRHVKTAAALKAEGVRAGVPDLFLALPIQRSHGVFIEMKKEKGGVVRESQIQMLELLRAEGFTAVVCYGFQDAAAFIERRVKRYLDEKDEEKRREYDL